MIKKKIKKRDLDGFLVLSIGMLASSVGMVVFYLARTGHYYDPVFWVSIAMVVAIPIILKEKR